MTTLSDVRVGDAIGPASRLVSREDVAAYAEAGGDRNPLHFDDAFARTVGFEGIIAHGMFTMGHLARTVTGWAGERGRIARIDVQFRAPVSMGETIVAGGTVREVDPSTSSAVLDLWVTVDRGGVTEYPIRRGEAEVVFDGNPGGG